MVMQTSAMKRRLMKIRAEIFLINMKKRLYGQLSDADKSRLRELMRQLSIKY